MLAPISWLRRSTSWLMMQRLAGLDDLAGQPLAIGQRHVLLAVLVREVDDPAGAVEQRHVGEVGVEDGADLLAHQLEQRGEFELAGELLRHRVDGGELGGALLRLGEQAGVFDGDRGLQRQADQEFQLAVGERLPAHPPHRHHALHGLPGQERRDHQPLVLLLRRARNLDDPRVRVSVVDELGAAALNHAADDARADLDHRGLDGRRDVADRHDGAVGLPAGVGKKDRAVLAAEQVLGVAGDAVHHGGKIQRRRDVAPDLDQRRGLPRAALRLVEEPRILQRDAHAVGERLQQAHVRVAERVLAVEVAQVDDSARLVARHQRDEDRRFLHLRSGQGHAAVTFDLPAPCSR